MKYFYAPIFNEADGRIVPGKDDDGSVVSPSGELPAGLSFPECDRGPSQRFAVVAPEDFTSFAGWTEKTKEEVNLDYPGLIP